MPFKSKSNEKRTVFGSEIWYRFAIIQVKLTDGLAGI
jgi:hypothetical protein